MLNIEGEVNCETRNIWYERRAGDSIKFLRDGEREEIGQGGVCPRGAHKGRAMAERLGSTNDHDGIIG